MVSLGTSSLYRLEQINQITDPEKQMKIGYLNYFSYDRIKMDQDIP